MASGVRTSTNFHVAHAYPSIIAWEKPQITSQLVYGYLSIRVYISSVMHANLDSNVFPSIIKIGFPGH